MSISTVKPIQIVPFPDKTTHFTTNSIVIDKPIWDKNDIYKKYNHMGQYIISSSSYFDNTTMPYKAFDGNTDSFWQCNTKDNTYDFTKDKVTVVAYSQTPFTNSTNGPSAYVGGGVNNSNYFKTTVGGTASLSTVVPGEWIQVQIPNISPIYLFRYTIVSPPKSSDGTIYFPKKFIVVGSKTGADNSWVYLNQQNLVDPPPNDSSTMSFDVNSTDYYFYYRFIFGEMYQGNRVVRINEITLYGSVEETPNSTNMIAPAPLPAQTATPVTAESAQTATPVTAESAQTATPVTAESAQTSTPVTAGSAQTAISAFTNMGDSKKLNYYAFSNMSENSSVFKISTPNSMPIEESNEIQPDTNPNNINLFDITSYVSILMTIAVSAIILYSIKK